jgi:peptidoglycan hydrolase CwlO-like protein
MYRQANERESVLEAQSQQFEALKSEYASLARQFEQSVQTQTKVQAEIESMRHQIQEQNKALLQMDEYRYCLQECQ